jgi:hypothetical protein
MGKSNTQSYIVEIELIISNKESSFILKKMRIAVSIYNACLNKALKLSRTISADKEYIRLLTLRKKLKSNLENHKLSEINKQLREIEKDYGFTEYAMHEFVKGPRDHFKDFGSHEAQALASRAFKAVQKVHYKQAKSVRFKSINEPISIEGKSNTSKLKRIILEDGTSIIKYGKDMSFDLKIKKNDYYIYEALEDKTKYVRIISKIIRNKLRFFVQLIQEGTPPIKNRDYGRESVGIDIGTSTMAVVSNSSVELFSLDSQLDFEVKKQDKLTRSLERSRRINNPEFYNKNGTINRKQLALAKSAFREGKRAFVWFESNRYKKQKNKLNDIKRKIKIKRKQFQEIKANEVISLGTDIKIEDMNIQGLQKRSKKTTINKQNGKNNKKKRFGKSINKYAPAQFINIIERKLNYVGKKISLVNTFKTKLSQFNHLKNEFIKKDLNERWNNLNDKLIQRDLYSAFLLSNMNLELDIVDINACNQSFNNFVELHDVEIKRLRSINNKIIKSIIK